MTRILIELAATLSLCAPAAAHSPTKSVGSLAAFPASLKLRGMDDAPQLVLTGKTADGREVDLTADATYSVSDAKVVRVDATGRVYPVGNGSAEIVATSQGQSVRVPVVAEKMDAAQPINFANHVVPIFTK